MASDNPTPPSAEDLARQSLQCLYLEADSSIADDVREKVLAAFAEIRAAADELEREVEGLKAANEPPKPVIDLTAEEYAAYKYGWRCAFEAARAEGRREIAAMVLPMAHMLPLRMWDKLRALAPSEKEKDDGDN